jgi:lipopolysaccharide assembly outer membrane protein LptD (OstA)
MKKFMFLLFILPLSVYAQKDKDPNEVRNDGKLAYVSSAKTLSQPAVRKDNSTKKLKNDNVYAGAVKFRIGSSDISADSAISYTNEGTIAFFNVKLANPQSFAINGDKLLYTKDDNTGELSSNISVSAMNGNVVGTSESLKVDFGYEIYRVVNGSLTPPPTKN